MVEIIDSITAEVQNVSRSGEDSIVTIEVSGASNKTLMGIPPLVTNMRARARALMTAGALPAGVETIKDVTAGDLERLTSVEDVKEKNSGKVVKKEYKIRVKG